MDLFSYLAVTTFVFVVGFSETESACGNGIGEQDGFCFLASRGYSKWWDANGLCQSYGCELAYPNTDNETTALISYATSAGLSDNYWLGLTDALEKGQWVDSGTHTLLSDIPWTSGSPSSSTNNNCGFAVTNAIEIKDESCGNQKKFICECPTV